MRIIGLTGGIASGKSTVARILERLGGSVIDADQLAREAVEPGTEALGAIIAEFGTDILNPDGTLNRRELGRIVFADPTARQRLEAITHPAIRRLADERLTTLQRSGAKITFYMAPLLVEAGAVKRVDEIWVVYVDRETQLLRLMARDSITREEALQRLEAQMPMEEKARYGKVVIDNSGSPRETEQRVLEVWEQEIL